MRLLLDNREIDFSKLLNPLQTCNACMGIIKQSAGYYSTCDMSGNRLFYHPLCASNHFEPHSNLVFDAATPCFDPRILCERACDRGCNGEDPTCPCIACRVLRNEPLTLEEYLRDAEQPEWTTGEDGIRRLPDGLWSRNLDELFKRQEARRKQKAAPSPQQQE